MIVYFDTSALVKRYIAEADSEAVLDLWDRAELLVSSELLFAEIMAAFSRRRREQPAFAAQLDSAKQAFRADWNTFYRIPVDADVSRRVDQLLSTHSLRGADAVHLASAMLLHDLGEAEVTFACADKVLAAAAAAEKLSIVP